MFNNRATQSMKPVFQLLLMCVVFGLAACNDEPESAVERTVCQDPRPEMCTREYRPVCGLKDTGIRCVTEPCPSSEHKTYGNACDACADPAVLSYSAGACEGIAGD